MRDLLILGCYRVECASGTRRTGRHNGAKPSWLVTASERDEASSPSAAFFRQNSIVRNKGGRPELDGDGPDVRRRPAKVFRRKLAVRAMRPRA